MKKILLISCLFNLLSVAGFFIIRNQRGALKIIGGLPVKKVVILLPAVHPAMDSIEQGFRRVLEQSRKADYEITTLNGNGNRQLMHAQVMQVFDSDADLIFTVGGGLASLAQKASMKKQSPKPIICSAVVDPLKLGLVQSLEKPGGQVTCVIDKVAMDKQVALLLSLKPTVQRVLLVYDVTQGGGLGQQQQALADVLQKRGIALKTLEVSTPAEVYAKTAAMITGCDVVMILKDHTAVSAVDALIKLCNQHGATLMTSDLDSGAKGAALSFGVEEAAFGERGAQLARSIVEDGVAVGDIPCQTPGRHYLQINPVGCTRQGIVLAEQELLLLGAVRVLERRA